MEGKEKGKPGRKAIVFDQEKIDQIEQLASQGLGPYQISKALGISWDTLDRNKKKNSEIAEAIKKGKAKGLAKVTNSLFNSANDGNVTAQIFYLKNRDPDSWADRQDVNYKIDIKKMLTDAHERIIEGETVSISNISDTFPKKKLSKQENEE
jgi:hypothetical protein